MNLQPTLENEIVLLRPLQQNDFDSLFAAASDEKIWEQHPNKNRYQLKDFTIYFEGALLSKGALVIVDKLTNTIIGCSRYYNYDALQKTIFIGYTFITTAYWGKAYNKQIKHLMINYAFTFVDKIYFHIGANNQRSQIAMQRIGGIKIKEVEVAYHGEPTQTNFEYCIEKNNWRGL
jgi:RimJ/RimL family protein N-acetyltransferase